MRLKKLFLCSLILLGSSLPVSTLAASFTCGTNGVPNSCTPGTMQNLINGAANGDTINIATGTHAWTVNAPVTVNKRLTISGDRRCTSGCGTSSTPVFSGTVTLNTGTNRAFVVNAPAGSGLVRITGIRFSGAPSFNYQFSDSPTLGGLFGVTYFTNGAACRIDNNHFLSSNGNGGWFLNGRCVLDHNWFDSQGPQGHLNMVQNFGASGNGDEVWALNPAPGTSAFVFFEDNSFTKSDGNSGDQSAIDAYIGGNYVARYNYFRYCDILNHDMSGGGDTRAGQFFEVYNNTFVSPTGSYQAPLFWREGNVYAHDNRYIGPWQALIKVWNQRITNPLGNWGICDGTKPWDSNRGPGGYRCADQMGTGKAAGLGRLNTQPQALFVTRVWNENISGLTGGRNCSGTQQHGGLVCNASPTPIINGTDYVFSTDGTAAPPGYTPYPYPHPLITAVPSAPAPPRNLRVQ